MRVWSMSMRGWKAGLVKKRCARRAQVKGKVNHITLDSCKKMALVFDASITGVDLVNCTSCKVQVLSSVRTRSGPNTPNPNPNPKPIHTVAVSGQLHAVQGAGAQLGPGQSWLEDWARIVFKPCCTSIRQQVVKDARRLHSFS